MHDFFVSACLRGSSPCMVFSAVFVFSTFSLSLSLYLLHVLTYWTMWKMRILSVLFSKPLKLATKSLCVGELIILWLYKPIWKDIQFWITCLPPILCVKGFAQVSLFPQAVVSKRDSHDPKLNLKAHSRYIHIPFLYIEEKTLNLAFSGIIILTIKNCIS